MVTLRGNIRSGIGNSNSNKGIYGYKKGRKMERLNKDKIGKCPFCGEDLFFFRITGEFICNGCDVHIYFPELVRDADKILAVNRREREETYD